MPPKIVDYAVQAEQSQQADQKSNDRPENANIPDIAFPELNTSVLRRHYPDVVTILHITSYAKIYVLDSSMEWVVPQDGGVEGSLFICELTPSPTGAKRFSVIILNRRNPTNFDWEIKSEEDIEIDEFIMIQVNESRKAYGIWIFEDGSDALKKAAEKILDCAFQAEQSRREIEHIERNEVVQMVERSAPHVPMGRQITLSELFGMQREQDSSWSVHDHHSGVTNWAPQQQPPSALMQSGGLDELFKRARQNYNAGN